MAKVKLTKNKYALVDDENFEWLNQFKWHLSSSGYAVRKIGPAGKQRNIYMHRIVLKCPNNKETDHINRNRIDNQRTNLRIASRSQNASNRECPRSSDYRGIQHRTVNSWRATIRINGKSFSLGHFASSKLAALAYDRAAKKYFGEFARCNFE